MTQPKTAAAALLLTLFGAATSANADPQEKRSVQRYELDVLSRATALSCDANHEFHQRLQICGVRGCTSIELDDRKTLSFIATRGETIHLATGVFFSVGGVVFGDTNADQLGVGAAGRFAHTVSGYQDCIKSVYYEIRPTE
jgi:hypothetical protein